MLIGLIIIAGCISIEPEYTFDLNIIADFIGCSAVNETFTDHEIIGDKLVFTTYALTPDLCYELKQIEPTRTGSNIKIEIEIKDRQVGYCGGCDGLLSLVYEIRKPPFNQTTMFIVINYKNEVWNRQNFTVIQ